jgi:hypothetical protein
MNIYIVTGKPYNYEPWWDVTYLIVAEEEELALEVVGHESWGRADWCQDDLAKFTVKKIGAVDENLRNEYENGQVLMKIPEESINDYRESHGIY